MKTSALIILILFLPQNTIEGQISSRLNDTISIGNVDVVERLLSGDSGYKVTVIDSRVINFTGGYSMAYLLERNSTLGIKNYGSNGLATASFRGMGANQTKIYWEGVPVNSSGNGQADLSIIPISRFNRIELYHGSSPVANGTGGPGGTISLITIPDWKEGTDIIVSRTNGSFGMSANDLTIIGGAGNFQSISQVFYRKADNNFKYIDRVNYPSPTIKTRVHNQSMMRGVAQNFFVRTGKNILSTNLFYNFSERELPGPIISDNQEGEYQDDEQLRIAVGLKRYSTLFSTYFKIGYIIDNLKYENNLISLLSEYQGRTAYLNGTLRYQADKKSSLELSFSNKFSTIESVNHSGYRKVNQAILKLEYKGNLRDRFSILILSEANHANGKLYIPSGSIGFDLLLENSKRLYLKGNLGNSITIPTLNDMYWIPGGNPDLNAETGINGELTLELHEKSREGLTANGELTIYNSRLSNMIKWLPGEYGIWSPINISAINSFGTEVDLDVKYRLPNHELGLRLQYVYNRVYNLNEKDNSSNPKYSQLLYVPLNQAIAELRYSSKRYIFSWVSDFTGLRYTTTDNSASIPGFISNDIELGYIVRIGESYVNTLFKINNIFNSEYEQVAFYPIPGRNYSLTLTYNLKNR